MAESNASIRRRIEERYIALLVIYFLFGNVSHIFRIMPICLPLHLLQEYKLFC